MEPSKRPWTIEGRSTVYDSDWIGLQLVDIRRPDGQVLHNVHFLDFKRPAAAMVPIGPDGRVLMIDQYRFQTDTRGWELPAGRVEPGETPEQGIARELREETGHRAGSLIHLGRYFPSNGSSNQTFHVFVGRGVERVGEIEDTNEVMGIRWFSPQEIRDLIQRNEMKNGLSLTALCWAFVRGELR